MRKAIRPTVLAVLLSLSACRADQPPGGWDAVHLVITNAVVTDVVSGTTEPGMALAVSGGRIVWTGRSDAVPDRLAGDAVDARGRFLVPGLADMHVHTEERDLPLFLAAGVTTVLMKHGDSSRLDSRRRAASGTLLAPRIYVAGPLMAGRPIHWPHVVVTTPAEARAEVERQAAAGYDFIKAYDFLDSDVYDTLAAAAREAGVPVIGHIPEDRGLEPVVTAGQTCIDHVDQLLYAAFGRGPSMGVPFEDARALVQTLRESDICLVPTLFGMKVLMLRGTAWFDSLYSRPEMARASEGIRGFWDTFRAADPDPEVLARRRHFYDVQAALTADLHRAGVLIVAGTDTPNLLLVPGTSLHDELRVLVHDVGLAPAEALRAATVDAAASIGAGEVFGRIAPGFSADIVLVDGNPLNDLNVLRRPAGVVTRGRWLDRAALDSLIATGSTP